MTYDEAMKRLRAVEPLPVGERLEKCLLSDLQHDGGLWNRAQHHRARGDRACLWAHVMSAASVGAGEYGDTVRAKLVDRWRSFARPLRHARERALQARAEMRRLREDVDALKQLGAEQALAMRDKEISRLCVLRGEDPVVIRRRMKKEFAYMLEISRLRAALDEAFVTGMPNPNPDGTWPPKREWVERIRAIAIAGGNKP